MHTIFIPGQFSFWQPSRYYNQHRGQLSFPSLRGSWIEYRPAWLWLRRGTFTYVSWQVTLC